MKNLLPIVAVLLLSGCSVLYPLYTKKDVVELPGLESQWLDKHQSGEIRATWTFEKTDSVGYILTEKEMGGNYFTKAHYIVFLKLEGKLFADVRMDTFDHDSLGRPIFTRDHLIFKVLKTDEFMAFLLFNAEYLVDLEKNGELEVSYQTHVDKSSDYNTGTSYMVTEPTKRLQKLVLKYYDEPEAFQPMMTLLKQ